MEICTLPNIKQIASGKKLQSTGTSALCFVSSLEGWDREGEREMQEAGDMGIYVYVSVIHFVKNQKLAHHCKQLYSNKNVKEKRYTDGK